MIVVVEMAKTARQGGTIAETQADTALQMEAGAGAAGTGPRDAAANRTATATAIASDSVTEEARCPECQLPQRYGCCSVVAPLVVVYQMADAKLCMSVTWLEADGGDVAVYGLIGKEGGKVVVFVLVVVVLGALGDARVVEVHREATVDSYADVDA